MSNIETLKQRLQEQFPEHACHENVGELTLTVPASSLIETAKKLQADSQFSFKTLVDLCGVDYLTYGQDEWKTDGATQTGFSRGRMHRVYLESKAQEYPERFAVVLHLLSVENNWRLRVKTFCPDSKPSVPSVVDIWSSANWYEREAFDMYGILFDGHPDLRRILTDYGFVGHPFRKDFPLIGHTEVRFDQTQARVVADPVSIEARTLVPRVIRDDHRYIEGDEA